MTRPDADDPQWTWSVPDDRATILQQVLPQQNRDPGRAPAAGSDEGLVWVGFADRVLALRGSDGMLRYEASGTGTPRAFIRQNFDQVAPAVVFDAAGQFTLCRPSIPRLKQQ